MLLALLPLLLALMLLLLLPLLLALPGTLRDCSVVLELLLLLLKLLLLLTCLWPASAALVGAAEEGREEGSEAEGCKWSPALPPPLAIRRAEPAEDFKESRTGFD